jgi:hypothetical protein
MGHPDGQNYAIWRGPDFLASASFALSNANPFMAQGLITNFASLCINFAADLPAGATVVVQWFTDSTEAIPVGQVTWLVPNGYELHVIIPAIGSFVTVAITTTSVPAFNCPISVYPTNTSVGVTSYWAVGNFVQRSNVVIPAATTSQFNLPYIAEGNGYVYGIDPGATGHLQLSVRDYDQAGVLQGVIAQINTLAGPITQNFIAPAFAVAVTIQNTDGAVAHNCGFYLAIDGRI